MVDKISTVYHLPSINPRPPALASSRAGRAAGGRGVGGTTKLFTEFLPQGGVEATLCPTEDHQALEAEIARGCRLVYLESPTNPTLKILDLARAAHEVEAIVVVDNTFATPINQRPLELGADLVLHSATKFLGGHSDAMGGVLVGARELVDRVFYPGLPVSFDDVTSDVTVRIDRQRVLGPVGLIGAGIGRALPWMVFIR